MKKCTVKFHGTAKLNFSRYHETPKDGRETHEVYEQRTWREKLHFNEDGHCFIPAIAFKNTITATCKKMRIVWKGKSEYGAIFTAGFFIESPEVYLYDKNNNPIHKDMVEYDRLFVPANGISGTRVTKNFPKITPAIGNGMGWQGEFTAIIIDEPVEDKFEEVTRKSGLIYGIMSFRPANNGMSGRYEIDSFKWEKF